MTKKKVPVRLCVATNQSFPKSEMFRIVKTPQGVVQIDSMGKVNGRGAYLSKTKEAVKKAYAKKLLDRKLETVVPDYIYQELIKLIGE